MKTLKQPSRFELFVDRFLESDLAMYIGGSIIGIFIMYVAIEVVS